jgi:pimeloyl-ACP methyl ester carboxylesterase
MTMRRESEISGNAAPGAEDAWTYCISSHARRRPGENTRPQNRLKLMVHRRLRPTWRFALVLTGGLLLFATPSLAQRGSILSDVPGQVRPDARYLIYLHARIVEEKGPRPTDDRFGVYEYQQILDTLAASGAVVIAEQRPQGTDFRAFGAHVADQVRRLMAAGVPAERIAVVGFSKGGAIAMVASALLEDPRIAFVFLGPCGDWVQGRDDVDVRGRILSIYEASDELGTSCEPLFAQASDPGEHREIRIATGAGHGAFFRPRPEWLDPLFQWIRRR